MKEKYLQFMALLKIYANLEDIHIYYTFNLFIILILHTFYNSYKYTHYAHYTHYTHTKLLSHTLN